MARQCSIICIECLNKWERSNKKDTFVCAYRMHLWCSEKILHPPLLVMHDAEGQVEWRTLNFSVHWNYEQLPPF